MQKTRYGLIAICMLLSSVVSAEAQVSISIGLPNVNIGVNLPMYPEFAPVQGYPVYYAPRVNANYFFYDGMYWVYQDDDWYASSWYNGPWGYVQPDVVPLYVLRIPVRYYRQPPAYFRGWRQDEPPRWDRHWGPEWEQHRKGWDSWKRSSAPRRAPLPVYQRKYSGDRYPRAEQQHELRTQQYRYQPQSKAAREYYNQQVRHGSTVPAQREGREAPQGRNPRPQDSQRSQPQYQTPQQQRGTSHQDQEYRRDQQTNRPQDREQRPQYRGESQEPNRGHGQNKDEDRGRGHNN